MNNNNSGEAAQKAMRDFLTNIVLKPLDERQKSFLPKLRTTIEDSVAVSIEDLESKIKKINELEEKVKENVKKSSELRKGQEKNQKKIDSLTKNLDKATDLIRDLKNQEKTNRKFLLIFFSMLLIGQILIIILVLI